MSRRDSGTGTLTCARLPTLQLPAGPAPPRARAPVSLPRCILGPVVFLCAWAGPRARGAGVSPRVAGVSRRGGAPGGGPGAGGGGVSRRGGRPGDAVLLVAGPGVWPPRLRCRSANCCCARLGLLLLCERSRLSRARGSRWGPESEAGRTRAFFVPGSSRQPHRLAFGPGARAGPPDG